jgi:hypothetical protein
MASWSKQFLSWLVFMENMTKDFHSAKYESHKLIIFKYDYSLDLNLTSMRKCQL